MESKDLESDSKKQKWINNPEWCFQFFDNEPVPFAYAVNGSKDPLEFQIYPIEDQGQDLTFKHNGMMFKIFVREMSEETKTLIEKEKNESKD